MNMEDFEIDKRDLKTIIKLIYGDNISLGTLVEHKDGHQYMIISLNTELSTLPYIILDICAGNVIACAIGKFELYYEVKGRIDLTDTSLTKIKNKGYLAKHVTIMNMIKNLKDIKVGSLIENNDGVSYDLVVGETEDAYKIFRLKLWDKEIDFDVIQNKIVDALKANEINISNIETFRYSRASRIVKQFEDIDIMLNKLKLLGYIDK